jgi:hypothetical protein
MWWHRPHGHNHQQMDFRPHMGTLNKRAVLRQQGRLSQQATRFIGKQITAGLKGDPAKHAAIAAVKIEGHLAAGEPKEAWHSLKGWYKATTDRAPKVSKMSLAAQAAEHVTLNGKVISKGDPLLIQVDKADVPVDFPCDGELWAVTRELRNGHATGGSWYLMWYTKEE